MTNAVEGQDDEFNTWYNEVHLPDVVRVEGFVAAQRFRLTETDPAQSFGHRYLSLYELETDDLARSRKALSAVAGTDAMVISPALDRGAASAAYFEPITERVKSEN
jgi:hypothetical protein